MEKSLKKGNRFSTLIRKTGVLWVMIVLYAVSVCVDPSHFLTGRNQINLLRNISLNGIIGLGMTFIILTGGIDLSVGSTVSVVAVSVAALLKNGVNPFLAVLAGILIGAAIGLINGLGVTKGKIPAFIMTLGTMTALEGVALIISAGKPVSWTESGIDFTWIGQKSLLGVPVVAFLFVILLLVCAFVLRYTPFGRGVYAIGDNKSAAKLCGINTFGVETLAYVIGGVLAAVTAYCLYFPPECRRPDRRQLDGNGCNLDHRHRRHEHIGRNRRRIRYADRRRNHCHYLEYSEPAGRYGVCAAGRGGPDYHSGGSSGTAER